MYRLPILKSSPVMLPHADKQFSNKAITILKHLRIAWTKAHLKSTWCHHK